MADNSQTTIDLGDIGRQVFLGRNKGEQARVKFKLDDADVSGTKFTVLIPESTYAVASSFFLGLFGPSVRAAGSREHFLAKFDFKAPSSIRSTIDSCIARALHEHKALIGGDNT